MFYLPTFTYAEFQPDFDGDGLDWWLCHCEGYTLWVIDEATYYD
jgi:hypothetical protein